MSDPQKPAPKKAKAAKSILKKVRGVVVKALPVVTDGIALARTLFTLFKSIK